MSKKEFTLANRSKVINDIIEQLNNIRRIDGHTYTQLLLISQARSILEAASYTIINNI